MGVQSIAQPEIKKGRQPRKISKATVFYVLAGLPVVAILAFAVFRPIRVLPRIDLAPSYIFTDQNGQRFSSEDMRAKIVLYNFAYTHCGPACDETFQVMRAVQERLGELDPESPEVHLVTISLDPERDGPEQLQAYAAQVGSGDNWHFITGPPQPLKNVVGGGFEVFYQEGEDGSIRFEPTLLLVDGWNILRAEYRGDLPTPEEMFADVDLLATEAVKSKGVSRYAYEAAHLFLCYP